MKAMIFAAGMGTRLKPLTDTMPKALVPVNRRPLLEHVILKMKAAGIQDIVINVHHFADQIIDFLNQQHYFNMNIVISDEREALLETGGALKKARWFLDDGSPFIVHNVDILSNVDLQALQQQHFLKSPLSTLVVSMRNTFRYFLFGENQVLCGWVNEKTGVTRPLENMVVTDYQKLAFSGIQIISPEIFPLMEQYPDRFSITDLYLENLSTHMIRPYVQENYKMLDVGKLDVLEEAGIFLDSL